MGPIDSASLLVAYILSFIKAIVLFKVVTFPANHLDCRFTDSAENHRPADFLGPAGDGDYELGKPVVVVRLNTC